MSEALDTGFGVESEHHLLRLSRKNGGNSHRVPVFRLTPDVAPPRYLADLTGNFDRRISAVLDRHLHFPGNAAQALLNRQDGRRNRSMVELELPLRGRTSVFLDEFETMLRKLSGTLEWIRQAGLNPAQCLEDRQRIGIRAGIGVARIFCALRKTRKR